MKRVMLVFTFVFAIFLNLNSMEIDQKNPISDALGFSLFYLMENNEKEKIFELLIFYKDKINLEVRNNYGATPLHIAAFLGLVDVVELLLQAEARIDSLTNRGLTPLHCAVINHYHYDGFLDSKKIDFHKHTKNHDLIIELLLKSGANANAKDNNGMTTLHYATGENYSFAIELLIYYKADIFIVSEIQKKHYIEKLTPFDIALKRRHSGTIFTFLKNGSTVSEELKLKMIKIIKQINEGEKISGLDFCQDRITEPKFDTSRIPQNLFEAFKAYYTCSFL